VRGTEVGLANRNGSVRSAARRRSMLERLAPRASKNEGCGSLKSQPFTGGSAVRLARLPKSTAEATAVAGLAARIRRYKRQRHIALGPVPRGSWAATRESLLSNPDSLLTTSPPGVDMQAHHT
jgi:hypothetical protein